MSAGKLTKEDTPLSRKSVQVYSQHPTRHNSREARESDRRLNVPSAEREELGFVYLHAEFDPNNPRVKNVKTQMYKNAL